MQVTISTDSPTAELRISGGDRFPGVRHKGRLWQGKLRPGKYTVTALVAQGSPQVKVLSIRSKTAPVVLTFRLRRSAKVRRVIPPRPPAPKPAKASLVPWVVLGVGGAAAIAGGVMLAVSASRNDTLHKNAVETRAAFFNQSSEVKADATRQLSQGFAANSALYAAGWVVAGVGLGGVVTGVVLLVTR